MITNKKGKGDKALTKYVIFSLAMVIAMTIVILILQTLNPETDYSTIYTVFASVFGGECLFSCILKIFKIKGESY